MSFFSKWFGPKNPDRTEEILLRYLDADFTVFPMAEHKATPAQVAALGDRLQVKFPDEFVAHVCGAFPGMFLEVKEAIWPRPQEFAVGPFWTFLYAVHTFTAAPQSEDWMRLDYVSAQLREDTGHVVAPLLQIKGDADLYCVTGAGEIVRFEHETGEMTPENVGFWELFEREVSALRERKDRKVKGEA